VTTAGAAGFVMAAEAGRSGGGDGLVVRDLGIAVTLGEGRRGGSWGGERATEIFGSGESPMGAGLEARGRSLRTPCRGRCETWRSTSGQGWERNEFLFQKRGAYPVASRIRYE